MCEERVDTSATLLGSYAQIHATVAGLVPKVKEFKVRLLVTP